MLDDYDLDDLASRPVRRVATAYPDRYTTTFRPLSRTFRDWAMTPPINYPSKMYKIGDEAVFLLMGLSYRLG